MKTTVKFLAAVSFSASVGIASAAGLGGVLNGMFANVSAPDVVTNQFRGTISGGGAYIRSPISNLNLISMDPPRLSAGCGGIDLYLGSFSFISADKLTQFIRNTAQNAAPLAFKMALDASFPQLGGILDKFQHMAQMMNDTNMNSCQMAHGLMDGAKFPSSETLQGLSKAVDAGLSTVQGWVSDYSQALTDFQTAPSKKVKEMQDATNSDGSPAAPAEVAGNQTWLQLAKKGNQGLLYQITDDENMSKQILMSLIGTRAFVPGLTNEADPKQESFDATIVLKQLFKPEIDATGVRSVNILSCTGGEYDKCMYVDNKKPFQTSGIEGFVKGKMFGAATSAETDTTIQPGSILYNMLNCSSATCGMTSSQMAFLNAVGRIPVIGLLRRSQALPSLMRSIAGPLVDEMVIEVSQVYGQAVLDMAIAAYAKSDAKKPDGYDKAISTMRSDLAALDKHAYESLTKINTISLNIDTAIRANGAVVGYKIR